ncbi:P-loop NTPase [Treponema sp.]|uniref:P-loop NTPase n=1 Tax=Treponema sp. TaxID=166 RepID=UPI00298E45C4|nr:P-loop NTPase [Treponema sp.]MCR5614269.1 P-loop NTPase [Treponema sp.]
MQIIPVASGKGGVGKSLLSANLAIALGQSGKRVVLADLDLGASNLHLVLGQQAPKEGLGTWLTGNGNFEDIIAWSDYENVRFIAGDSEIPGLTSLKAPQRNKLIKAFKSLDCDYLVIDLGAGTHQIILDLFLLSPQGIVVTAPAVTATLNGYLFLKNAVFRLMTSSFKPTSAASKKLTQLKKDPQAMQRLYIPKLIEEIRQVDPENAEKFEKRLKLFKPRLIMNMIEDPKDADRAQRIRASCNQYLGLDLEHLGIMYRDSLEDRALASRLPVIIYKPQCVLSQAIYRITEKILASEALSFDDDFTPSDDLSSFSFEQASEEAAEDFELKISGIQDLVGSGALTTGELIETIKMQNYELTQIRKENNLLKSKLLKAVEQGFKI